MSPVFSGVTRPKFTKFFRRYRGIIYAVNADIEVAISHSVLDWQSDKCRVGNFAPFLPLNRLPWQCPFRYQKKKDVSIIGNLIPTIWSKDFENRSRWSSDTLAPSEEVRYDTKLVAMVKSLEESEKVARIKKIHANAFNLVKRSRKSVQ